MIRNTFRLSHDGWIHLCPLGEYPWTGKIIRNGKPTQQTITQVLDMDALRRMASNIEGEILIDYDHESWDPAKRTTAAGWINRLEVREDGLWGLPRWSTEGAEDIIGGNFRYISPTFRHDDCEDLGNGRLRPRRLADCAVTNKPNLPVHPITNKQGDQPMTYKNKGTSEGAKKGWATRRAGGWVPKKPKKEKTITKKEFDNIVTKSESHPMAVRRTLAGEGYDRIKGEKDPIHPKKSSLKAAGTRKRNKDAKMLERYSTEINARNDAAKPAELAASRAAGQKKAAATRKAKKGAEMGVSSKEPPMSLSDFYAQGAYGHRGTSEGAKKGWATRRAGGWVPKKPKQSAKTKAMSTIGTNPLEKNNGVKPADPKGPSRQKEVTPGNHKIGVKTPKSKKEGRFMDWARKMQAKFGSSDPFSFLRNRKKTMSHQNKPTKEKTPC